WACSSESGWGSPPGPTRRTVPPSSTRSKRCARNDRMNLVAIRAGVGIAVDSLRANKVRAALTILGIVIGVATVMAMSAMIVGIRTSVTGQLEAFGPDNLFVDRFDQTALQLSDVTSQRPPWEGKPPITPAEADLVEAL